MPVYGTEPYKTFLLQNMKSYESESSDGRSTKSDQMILG